MMQRRIFPWAGLVVLVLLFGLCPDGFAREQYTVARGDTLSGIAKKLGVSTRALRKANNLKGSALKPSQVLAVPQKGKSEKVLARGSSSARSASRYVVRKGDTLSRIARKTGVPAAEITALNHIRTRSLKIGRVLILPGPPPEEVSDNACAAGDAGAADCEEEGDGGIITTEANTESDQGSSATAELLGKWKSSEERQLFVKVAMGFLGAPYRLGGSSIRGLDCSAFVKKIYDFFGVTLPRTAREQARLGISILREELEAGDLVFFNTRRLLGHVGIYIGNNEFIHASSRNRGVRIDSLEAPYFNRHFVKAVRLNGLDGGT